MVFSSITFLSYFLPLLLLGYYISNSHGIKNTILLFASLLFYAWGEPKNIGLMVLSILFNYASGLMISSYQTQKNKSLLILSLTIFLNLLLLFYFKYFGFTLRMINSLSEITGISHFTVQELILPIGISFYTFQSISYLIDIYREPEKVQKNVLHLGLYIACFPQLIAGPIVRYHHFSDQITNRTHSLKLFIEGIERFIIGLSKKVLIANVMAETVDGIFALPAESLSTQYTWIAILAYSLQIYFDFSGYSDMAIGLGKMFGFHFEENFNYPYLARSISEFWRRWHISLSSWFRDYVYIPLGGNRKGMARTYYHLWIVFFITGLWHGASFAFILWGLGHGLFITLEKIFFKFINVKQNLLFKIFSHTYTLLVVVMLWTFFRTGTKYGFSVIKKLAGFPSHTSISLDNEIQISMLIDFRFYLIFIIGCLLCFPWWKKIQLTPEIDQKIFITKILAKYLLLLALLCLSYISISNNSYNPFIYFRF